MKQISMDLNTLEAETLETNTLETNTLEAETLETKENTWEEEEEESDPQVFTVSRLNNTIRNMLEGEFPLIWIQGEIFNFKAHSSGHHYFSLKDKKAQVNAVMFRSYNRQLKFSPENGMEVLIRGKVTVYEPRGNYQIFCEIMEPLGSGVLQIAFDQLKSKLEKEGLYDLEKKQSIPAFPQHVALVTSPTGAAIRDMLNVLGRRFKNLKVTVVPALVQGDQSPKSLIQGLLSANQLPDVDVIIIGRGGGSMKDLWCFNDEALARAIASSALPVISAVGHEVDVTIADLVADLRAPTPSAAAELVVKNAEEVSKTVMVLRHRLKLAIDNQLKFFIQQLENFNRHLVDPQRKLRNLIQRCDELNERLVTSVNNFLQTQTMKLNLLMEFLESLSPLKVVGRGYSIVKTLDGQLVRSASQLDLGDKVSIRLYQDEVLAKIEKIKKGVKGSDYEL